MNSQPGQSPSSAGGPELPALHSSNLDRAQVAQLLADIEACTELLEILPKHSARGQVAGTATLNLAQARELLAAKTVRGLQIRYRYDGAEWWDTLMITGDLVRIVRIRHDFDTSQPARKER